MPVPSTLDLWLVPEARFVLLCDETIQRNESPCRVAAEREKVICNATKSARELETKFRSRPPTTGHSGKFPSEKREAKNHSPSSFLSLSRSSALSFSLPSLSLNKTHREVRVALPVAGDDVVPLGLEALGEVRGDEATGTRHADAEALALEVGEEGVLCQFGGGDGVGHGCLLFCGTEGAKRERTEGGRKGEESSSVGVVEKK